MSFVCWKKSIGSTYFNNNFTSNWYYKWPCVSQSIKKEKYCRNAHLVACCGTLGQQLYTELCYIYYVHAYTRRPFAMSTYKCECMSYRHPHLSCFLRKLEQLLPTFVLSSCFAHYIFIDMCVPVNTRERFTPRCTFVSNLKRTFVLRSRDFMVQEKFRDRLAAHQHCKNKSFERITSSSPSILVCLIGYCERKTQRQFLCILLTRPFSSISKFQ